MDIKGIAHNFCQSKLCEQSSPKDGATFRPTTLKKKKKTNNENKARTTDRKELMMQGYYCREHHEYKYVAIHVCHEVNGKMNF